MLRAISQPISLRDTDALRVRPIYPIAPSALPNRLLATLRHVTRTANRIGNSLFLTRFFRKHLTKREAAFIAAAYAIPLPGTALLAALLVWIRRLFLRHVTHRLPTALPALRRPDAVLLLETGEA